MGGPVQIACLGVEQNDCSTQLVATVVKENPPQPTVHLAIIQACFTLSSRVLLVSNLRRSNWKCTVKRFFKSTVMMASSTREGVATSSGECITLAVKQGMDAKVFSLTLSVKFRWFSALGSVCRPTTTVFASEIRLDKNRADEKPSHLPCVL